MFKQFLEWWLEMAVSDTPVVLVVGPRRAGKTTLVKNMREVWPYLFQLDDRRH